MKARNLIAALYLTAGLFAGSAQATIIYEIDRTIGNGSVKGTITTDGTLGSLWEVIWEGPTSPQLVSHVVNWDLTLDDGFGSFRLGDSGTLTGGVPALYGTESNLVYDFDSNGGLMFQEWEIGDGGPFWDLSGGVETVYSGPHVYNPNIDWDEVFAARHQSVERSGQVVIGWASTWNVPEPGSLALMALGFAGLGGARRLKRG